MGSWTKHPTGNDSVQDNMCEVTYFLIRDYHEENKTYNGETFKDIDEIMNSLEDDGKLNLTYFREVLSKDKNGYNLMVNTINGILYETGEIYEETKNHEEFAEYLIAIVFTVLELRVELDKYIKKLLVHTLKSARLALSLCDIECSCKGFEKVHEDMIKMLGLFIENWEYIMDTYIEDDNTYLVIIGVGLFDSFGIKDGSSDSEQMKKDIKLFDLLGI